MSNLGIGARLRQLRIENNKNQQQIGKIVGVHESTNELARRAELRTRRAELLDETLLLVHGGPDDIAEMDRLDVEIEAITAELEAM